MIKTVTQILVGTFLFMTVPTQAATLSGLVRDSEGAVISKARIIVHGDHSGSNYLKDNLGSEEDIVVITDSEGKFSLDLKPGFYDVFSMASSFSPHCDKIRVKDQETKTYNVKLKLSAVTSRELD